MSNESMANLITDTPSDVAELLALANYQEKQILELIELLKQVKPLIEEFDYRHSPKYVEAVAFRDWSTCDLIADSIYEWIKKTEEFLK